MTVGVAVVAAGLVGSISCWGEGLLLLLILAGNTSCQAEAEPAVAESDTFQDYL